MIRIHLVLDEFQRVSLVWATVADAGSTLPYEIVETPSFNQTLAMSEMSCFEEECQFVMISPPKFAVIKINEKRRFAYD